ncbi:MAG TPA: hypothetical protein VHX44_16955 [Planctomycetota bacterium]|nr:hypothetical protein [Planctomycetota bacterium]
MHYLIFLLSIISPLQSLELIEQHDGYVRCSLMYYVDDKNHIGYDLIMRLDADSFVVSYLNLEKRETIDVHLQKAVALELYRKLLAAVNRVRVDGSSERRQSDDSFQITVTQSGFNLLIKVPSLKDGYDDQDLRALHRELAVLVDQERKKTPAQDK